MTSDEYSWNQFRGLNVKTTELQQPFGSRRSKHINVQLQHAASSGVLYCLFSEKRKKKRKS